MPSAPSTICAKNPIKMKTKSWSGIVDPFLGNARDPGFLEIATIAEAVEQAVVALGLPFHTRRHGALGLSIRWPPRAF